MGERPEAGYRTVPHTADVRIEAWAPTRERCVTEAVAALVAVFARPDGERPTDTIDFSVEAGADEDMLASVLDEVIYRLDTSGQVPVGAEIRAGDANLDVQMQMVDVGQVEVIGATPKAVSLHDLRFAPDPSGSWSCAVTLDV